MPLHAGKIFAVPREQESFTNWSTNTMDPRDAFDRGRVVSDLSRSGWSYRELAARFSTGDPRTSPSKTTLGYLGSAWNLIEECGVLPTAENFIHVLRAVQKATAESRRALQGRVRQLPRSEREQAMLNGCGDIIASSPWKS